MKKHNATYYNNRINRLRDQIAEKEKRLTELEKLEIVPDEWNDVYDEIFRLREKIRDVEFRRDTQDWTGQEWANYALCCDNID